MLVFHTQKRIDKCWEKQSQQKRE